MKNREFVDYLKSRLAWRGMQKRLAIKIKVNAATVSNWVSGKMTPRFDRVIEIAQFFGDDPADVLSMAGYAKEASRWVATQLPIVKEGHPEYQYFAPLPVVGNASAGDINLTLDYTDQGFPPGAADDYVDISRHGANDYAIRVRGNSLDPACPDGSILVASPEKNIRTKGLCVVRLRSGECWVKQVIIHNEYYTLISVNPIYRPIHADMKDVRYIHPITWVKLP